MMGISQMHEYSITILFSFEESQSKFKNGEYSRL